MNNLEYYWFYLLCKKVFNLEFNSLDKNVVQISIPNHVNISNVLFGKIVKFMLKYSSEFKKDAIINKVYVQIGTTWHSIPKLEIDYRKNNIKYAEGFVPEELKRIVTNLSGLRWE